MAEDSDALSSKIINEKYDMNFGKLRLYNPGDLWGVLCGLESGDIKIKLGNGDIIMFWQDSWIQSKPLASDFPLIFNVSCFRKEMVSAFWNKEGDSETWVLHLKKNCVNGRRVKLYI